MAQQRPITPPPSELVLQWIGEYFEVGTVGGEVSDSECFLTARAAQWGADQELEACCEFLHLVGDLEQQLRAARRPSPKPPSLKEQALDALTLLCKGPDATAFVTCRDTIRRALEQLPDHEPSGNSR